ncbi:hypothetical protein NQ315_012852 [Exocentrus adspersus]|uniref:Neugrin n=1 Tax=Exocentrus adspersus TaxID=1586481 RepID=A0AAV8V797_9CUCU|nr:hypothetical protein NQ315_012852 [Exocentrus adspersus]
MLVTIRGLTEVFLEGTCLRKLIQESNYAKKVFKFTEEVEETDFDNLEADFMHVHKTHKQHVRETEAAVEREKLYMIRQKYFKEKHVNFLTFNEKEQIRYLYNTNCEEWTVEKLAESFPALPQDIKKILRAKWTMKTSRIINHDMCVQKNWIRFKNGEISGLPQELIDHLNKFTNRDLHLKSYQVHPVKDDVVASTKLESAQFLEIISSYRELKTSNRMHELTKQVNTEASNNMCSDLEVDQNKINNDPITLHQLQKTIESNLHSGKGLSEDDKLLVKTANPQVDINETNQIHLEDIIDDKYETNESVLLENRYCYNHLIYPQKIVIPKNLRKIGYIYKLNDCYYDHEGYFLYRVPGIY